MGDLGDVYVANKALGYRYGMTWTYQGFHFACKKMLLKADFKSKLRYKNLLEKSLLVINK